MERREVRKCAIAIRLTGPDDLERRDQPRGPADLMGIASILNQFHHHKARHGKQFSQSGKPGHGWSVASLDVDQYVGIDPIHCLRPLPLLRSKPQGAGVSGRIHDIGPGSNKPFILPIGD